MILPNHCPRLTRAVGIAAALAYVSPTACSPYVFTDNVQTFNTKMGAIDSSYQDSAQKIVAERHLTDRTLWIHNKPALMSGPGCDTDAANSLRCDLVTKGTVVPTAKP